MKSIKIPVSPAEGSPTSAEGISPDIIHHVIVPNNRPEQNAPFTWKCNMTATIIKDAIPTTTCFITK